MNREQRRHLMEQFLLGKSSIEGEALFNRWFANQTGDEAFEQEVPQVDRQAMQQRMWATIKMAQEPANGRPMPVAGNRRPLWANTRWIAAAACVAVVILAGLVGWYINTTNTILEQTAYGETRSIQLPDGSRVTLNGNSKLTYRPDWQNQTKPRQVQLTGEAFFSVTHTKSHQPFQVITDKGVVVNVLGTEFNVSARPSQTDVVLQSGTIQLTTTAGRDTLLLKPGDLVRFDAQLRRILNRPANPKLYTSWKEHKLLFDKTPLRDIVHMLKETYGLEVNVKDRRLLTRHVSGSIPSHNVQLLLDGLSASCNLVISHDANQITIQAP